MIDTNQLRRLYPAGESGTTNRVRIKITITPETLRGLKSLVRFGKGSFGSPFIELATRLLISLMTTGEDIEMLSVEISALKNPYVLQNLKRLVRFLEA